jgi:hypothetical protein
MYMLRFDYMLPRIILEHRDIATRTAAGTVKLNIGISHVRPWMMSPMSPISTRLDDAWLYSMVNVRLATPSMGKEIRAQLPVPLSFSARTWWPMRAMKYLSNSHFPGENHTVISPQSSFNKSYDDHNDANDEHQRVQRCPMPNLRTTLIGFEQANRLGLSTGLFISLLRIKCFTSACTFNLYI